MQIFLDPVVRLSVVEDPNKMFSPPVVSAAAASNPTATLLDPEVANGATSSEMYVFLAPEVIAAPEPEPRIRLSEKLRASLKSSMETFEKDTVPEPFVPRYCPLEPSVVGSVKVVTKLCRLASYANTSVPITRPSVDRAVAASASSSNVRANDVKDDVV
jgi:hypothetical protein